MKTYPLNGSPRHWHYILHTGESSGTREQISTESFKTFKAAYVAGKKVADKNTAIAGLECHHPTMLKGETR